MAAVAARAQEKYSAVNTLDWGALIEGPATFWVAGDGTKDWPERTR